MENLDVEAEFGGVAANALIVFRQGHGPEDFGLHLAAHVHAGAVNDEDSWHDALLGLAAVNLAPELREEFEW